MPSAETLITFSLAALLLSISPGPSNLYIMARSVGQGHQAGIAAAGGMAIGSFIYLLASGVTTFEKGIPFPACCALP
ncbi:MAG: threonine/homoserine/homoserine lactone efflux protein [Paraglaciecola sp.]|jgi:threonine/homoserine/homoserine lactone efflux protein